MITPDRARILMREHENHRPKALLVAAPEMAQTIAGMRTEWGVEQDNTASSPEPRRWTQWYADEAVARASGDVLAGIGKRPVLVRRLVSAPEVVEGE